jgi:multiple sugar transport system permease protein
VAGQVQSAVSRAQEATFVEPKRGRFHVSLRTREAIDCYVFILPAVLGLLLFYLGPMAASLGLSFTDYNMLKSPAWVGLENYRTLMHDDLFWQSLKVTAI